VGERWESDHLLSVRRSCGHTWAFHSSDATPLAGGRRFEGRMQDGMVSSVELLPIGLHPELGTSLRALRSFDLYV
jgi:hypothetical protein